MLKTEDIKFVTSDGEPPRLLFPDTPLGPKDYITANLHAFPLAPHTHTTSLDEVYAKSGEAELPGMV